MRPRARLPHLRLRSTRAAVVAMVGVLAGATGVAGIAHQLTLVGQPQAVPAEAEPTESELTPSMRAIIPAGLRSAGDADTPLEDAAHRAPVGSPEVYRGSIVKAPGAAVAAYQRAEMVINQAAECGLEWTVLAAVARVESNHGEGEDRNHRVTKKGQVEPAYVGAPLNGRGGRGALPDTDLGDLDGNRSWDAPVGPMGLLPTRWAAVAVDADGNDQRDPQDLDDAALGAAVFLCAEITRGREASEVEGGLDTSAARSSRRPARPATPGERPVKPAEVGGFEAQAADGLRTSTTEKPERGEKPAEPEESERSEESEKSEKSEKQLLRQGLREYHDGKRFVSTVLALRKRYDKQAEKLPAYAPPGGLDIPDLPPLCDCVPPRSAGDGDRDNDGTRSPDGGKDGPRSPSPGGRGAEPGDGGGSGTGTPGTPSPSDPSPDPPTSDEPTDPSTSPTDPSTSPTDPSTSPTAPSTSDEPSATPSDSTSDPPATSAPTSPSITP
jgi:hypothetical protein